MRARRLFPVLALAVGVVAAIGLAESLLRVWVWTGVPASNGFLRFMKAAEGEFARGPLFRRSRDPGLGVECVPNGRRGFIRINSHGFRGGEVTDRPAGGVVRVAVIGDSETFSAALPEEATMPGCLATALNAAAAAHRYEVLNLGVPGYNTAQELRVVETRLPSLHPSVAVLYYVLNDAELTPRTVLLRGGGPRSSRLWLLASYLSTSRWPAGLRLPAEVQELRGDTDIVDYYHRLYASDYFTTTGRLIRQMATLLRKRGVRFVLVIAPEVYGIPGFKRYPYRDIHAQLTALASPDIELVDPLERLAAAGKRPRDYWVGTGDPHKNEEANRVIAAAVADALLKPGPRSR